MLRIVIIERCAEKSRERQVRRNEGSKRARRRSHASACERGGQKPWCFIGRPTIGAFTRVRDVRRGAPARSRSWASDLSSPPGCVGVWQNETNSAFWQNETNLARGPFGKTKPTIIGVPSRLMPRRFRAGTAKDSAKSCPRLEVAWAAAGKNARDSGAIAGANFHSHRK